MRMGLKFLLPVVKRSEGSSINSFSGGPFTIWVPSVEGSVFMMPIKAETYLNSTSGIILASMKKPLIIY